MGIRVLDKSTMDDICYKYEVWVNFLPDKSGEKYKAFEQTLQKMFNTEVFSNPHKRYY